MASQTPVPDRHGLRVRFGPDDPPPPLGPGHPRLDVGPGPDDGYATVPGQGFTGTRALRVHGGPGEAVLLRTDIPVTDTTRLTYHVFPGHHHGDLACPSTFVGLDLRFDDGGLLSGLGARDQYGNPVTPTGQGEAGFLFTRQWNRVEVDLPAGADGRRVVEVLVRTGAPWSDRDDCVAWIDEIVIDTDAPTREGIEPVDLVDTRRGSNGGFGYSRGNTFPATAVPNGFTFLTPTTATAEDWIYSWARHNTASGLPALHGIAFSHQPSPWMGDRDQLVVSPWLGVGAPPVDPAERAATFSHDEETARPHRYDVRLDGGLDVSVAPTDHGAVLRFARPPGPSAERLVLVVGSHVEDCHAELTGPRTVRGWVDGGSPLSVGRSRMYFHGVLDADATDLGVAGADGTWTPNPDREPGTADGPRALGLDPEAVTLRIATSFLSLDQAARTLEMELTGRDLDEVASAARDLWAERLAVLDLDAGHHDRVTAYAGLYRLNLYPNSGFENTGTASAPVWEYASPVLPHEGESTDESTGAVVVPGKVYVNNGFWDTYRTAWPLYGLAYPERAAVLADGFVEHYRTAGWIPRWSSPGLADLMTGTSSDVAFADLHAKGVDLPDAVSAYRAGLRNATVLPPVEAVGRKDLRESAFVGFPSPDTHEPVSWAFEAVLNDAALAAMADRLASAPDTPEGDRERLLAEAAYLRGRSMNYVHGFDAATGFFASRWRDGRFRTPASEFDPLVWGGDYTEANAWDFAFPAPHDGAGLASLYGRVAGTDGPAALEAKLDAYMTIPEYGVLHGTYPDGMHEITEARDLRTGQFAVSNQPAHHIPFMYAFTPSPAKSGPPVVDAVRRLYAGADIGQGFPGDEDNGEMSAWWLFAATGLYPLQVGSSRYAVTTPAFGRMTWHLPGGDLEVVARRVDGGAPGPRDVYVQGVRVDGVDHDRSWIDHAEISGGARIEVVLGSAAGTWASGPDASPPSVSGGHPAPWRDVLTPGTTRVEGAAASDRGSGRAVGGDGRDPGLALVDDEARTPVRFDGPTRVLTWSAPEGSSPVRMYTLTSADDPDAAPTSWRLEGSRDGGATWETVDERVGEPFEWPWQIRPFPIGLPAGSAVVHGMLRLVLPVGVPVELGQVEFLA